jgi:uncharacterized delta-60 repeat protein
MKNKITFLLLIAFSAFSTISFAQDGAVDLSFNAGDTGYNNTLEGNVYVIEELSDGKVIIGGVFTEYLSIPTKNLIRLNDDETIDQSFNVGSGPNGSVNSIIELLDGKLLISGGFTSYNGTACNGIARLNNNGTLDNTFISIGVLNSAVIKMVLSNDGRIAAITRLRGGMGETVVRFNSDGSLDPSFNIGTGNGSSLTNIAAQQDGKLIVTGLFSSYNSTNVNGVVRLNINGSVDTGFIVNLPLYTFVSAANIQQNGKVIITISGPEDGRPLIRYNTDGSEDATFVLPDEMSDFVAGLTLQSDNKIALFHEGILKRINDNGNYDTTFTNVSPQGGQFSNIAIGQGNKIYLSGYFNALNDILDNGLARLNSDGSKDMTFDIGPATTTGADGSIGRVYKQGSKIIISGSFSSYNGEIKKGTARLNSDGTLDSTFIIPEGINGGLTICPDGKIIINNTLGYLQRLNVDGSIDTSFNSLQFSRVGGYAALISDIKVQDNGKILVGGSFSAYGNTPVFSLCRLNTDGSLDTSFNSSLFTSANTDLSLNI